jgi:glycosidase
VIWLSPGQSIVTSQRIIAYEQQVYKSPKADMGYDISDYEEKMA